MNLINKLELDKILHKKHLEKYSDEVFNEILNIIKNGLENKIKELKNKERVNKNDDSKPKIKAIEYLNKKEIEILPKWVKNDIDKAVIIGKSKQVIQLENGKKYHLKNKLNDLSGAEWNYFLNSVLCTRYKTSGKDSYAHEIRKEHPSPKPPQLMRDIISFFTKEDELVFDYFAGVGGTLLGSSLCNRKAIGFDLSDRYKDIYMKANKNLDLKEQKFICGDSLELLKNNNLMQNLFKNELASLILIDPPYGDMLSRPKTGETLKQKKDTSPTPFTNLKNDLGNMNWQEFLEKFKESVGYSIKYLKKGGHLIVFIKDLQPKGDKDNLLHADIIKTLNTINELNYIGNKIWADLNVNLYPYGYPFSFVANQIHQFILVFKKK
ncbi:DNA methyltransferase [Helicobacter pylori]|uniref:DNA methyltransferase n=3 Tax=Helicobacter pylori TaxID=210 RepID=UPI0002B971F2|nr:DNA methyltransferase [Helicobacter pylori]NHA73421.1 RNA methyltransferase [Helicobacter pylori]RDY76731.1 RNA methyltransferase [Helicobacter pylori]RDY79120.1 RNA methyltransferase [Helicobacter pylori]RDY79379.1 RNA methyltransferase [Helicobacter pylori]WQX44905.1 site-specific DNA-methyltransferase [Helicobacter pylori]